LGDADEQALHATFAQVPLVEGLSNFKGVRGCEEVEARGDVEAVTEVRLEGGPFEEQPEIV